MTYSIGEVEELTGIKAHVLRYWEEVIPGFAPQKDMGGRRTYTQREIEMIFRLKYLINETKVNNIFYFYDFNIFILLVLRISFLRCLSRSSRLLDIKFLPKFFSRITIRTEKRSIFY